MVIRNRLNLDRLLDNHVGLIRSLANNILGLGMHFVVRVAHHFLGILDSSSDNIVITANTVVLLGIFDHLFSTDSRILLVVVLLVSHVLAHLVQLRVVVILTARIAAFAVTLVLDISSVVVIGLPHSATGSGRSRLDLHLLDSVVLTADRLVIIVGGSAANAGTDTETRVVVDLALRLRAHLHGHSEEVANVLVQLSPELRLHVLLNASASELRVCAVELVEIDQINLELVPPLLLAASGAHDCLLNSGPGHNVLECDPRHHALEGLGFGDRGERNKHTGSGYAATSSLDNLPQPRDTQSDIGSSVTSKVERV